MVYAQSRICPEEWDTQTPLGFSDTSGSSNPGQTTRLYDNHQQKRELEDRGLCWPQSEIDRKRKKDEYLYHARKLKKNCGTWKWRLYHL